MYKRFSTLIFYLLLACLLALLVNLPLQVIIHFSSVDESNSFHKCRLSSQEGVLNLAQQNLMRESATLILF